MKEIEEKDLSAMLLRQLSVPPSGETLLNCFDNIELRYDTNIRDRADDLLKAYRLIMGHKE